MSKTIEEAAREYANENMWYPGETSYESDIIAMEESFADAFKAGATHVLSLPLSQRLTTEEREKMRKMYKRMVVDVENSDSYDCVPASDLDNVMETLESIFGKELFEEGEG